VQVAQRFLFGFADSGSLALAEFDCAAKGSIEVRGRLLIMDAKVDL